MTRYQRIAWEDLETTADLTPIELKGNIYSLRYEDIPLLLYYHFSGLCHDFTKTYFITIRGGRGIFDNVRKEREEKLEKIVDNQLPVSIKGQYLASSCSISVNSINICGGGGRLSLINSGDGILLIADQGKISLKE